MNVRFRIGAIVVAGLVGPGAARADHAGMAMGVGGAGSRLAATLSLVAAQFSTLYYGGSYEGVLPAVTWSRGRFTADAAVGAYRIEENGLTAYGVGDLAVDGSAMLFERGELRAGASLAVSAPTGDETHGLGMGHVMVMAAGWGTWQHERLTLAASAGYSRALFVPGGHDHGPWPLVDPMNLSELTWSASGEVAIGRGVSAGGRASGGIPVGARPGQDRVIGALRVAWERGRLGTAAEVQAGLAGDPFEIRAVLETALRF